MASSMYCVISSRPTLMLARVLGPKSTSGGLQTSVVSLQYLNMANCLFFQRGSLSSLLLVGVQDILLTGAVFLSRTLAKLNSSC